MTDAKTRHQLSPGRWDGENLWIFMTTNHGVGVNNTILALARMSVNRKANFCSDPSHMEVRSLVGQGDRLTVADVGEKAERGAVDADRNAAHGAIAEGEHDDARV